MTITKETTMSVRRIDTHQLEKFNEQYASAPKKLRAWARGEGHLGAEGPWQPGQGRPWTPRRPGD